MFRGHERYILLANLLIRPNLPLFASTIEAYNNCPHTHRDGARCGGPPMASSLCTRQAYWTMMRRRGRSYRSGRPAREKDNDSLGDSVHCPVTASCSHSARIALFETELRGVSQAQSASGSRLELARLDQWVSELRVVTSEPGRKTKTNQGWRG